MSMYLPNSDVRPTGAEPGEFIEAPPPPAQGLALQTRLDIARWAEEYIADLVETHAGGPADVRSIIHELHGRNLGTNHDLGR